MSKSKLLEIPRNFGYPSSLSSASNDSKLDFFFFEDVFFFAFLLVSSELLLFSVFLSLSALLFVGFLNNIFPSAGGLSVKERNSFA